MRALITLITWGVVVVTALSLIWTTVKARRILRRALGRELRKGEENSSAIPSSDSCGCSRAWGYGEGTLVRLRKTRG